MKNIKLNKTVLCIIDGLGIANEHGNAIAMANMQNLWNAFDKYPSTTLIASGHEVGLSDEKDAGNSEVGHNAIGAGQIIKQGLALLNDQFKSGKIFQSDTWKKLVNNIKNPSHVKSTAPKLNIIILLSDGRVHSDIEHLFLTLNRCAIENIPVSIHAIADGRDVSPQSILVYLKQTQEFIDELESKHNDFAATIATIGGRGRIFMDRYESNIQIPIRGFETITGNATYTNNIENLIKEEYAKNPKLTDENLPNFVLDNSAMLNNGDSVLLLNYRGDRALQTCAMFETGKYLTNEQFSKIDKCMFAGILQYDSELLIPKNYLCPPPVIENTLTEWLVKHNARQLSVTETVKFGHLTYYFNGNKGKKISEDLETWIEIKSDELNGMFNKKPRMKAPEITKSVIKAIHSNKYDFIKCNLPNPDMVGHTGDLNATIEACKCVDECLGELITICLETNTNLVICADHGNAEEMFDAKTNQPKTAHTNNLVPCILVKKSLRDHYKQLPTGMGLTNIAATICDLMDIKPSPHFKPSLLERAKAPYGAFKLRS